MLERYYVTPENMYTTGGNEKILYTPIVIVRSAEHAHVYVAGRTARLPNGELAGAGDMRAQLRLVCQNTGQALEYVGADFSDVVRTTTYTMDIEEYYRCSDERFKFFTDPLPTSTLIGVARLGWAEMLVEIEVEAIMEPERLKIPANAVRK